MTDSARTAAARLLGRASAKAATPEEREDRARLGGKAAQKELAKLDPEARSAEMRRRAIVRWDKRKSK